MKKVLSIAMASAMVLGMGANAFALEYSSTTKDTSAWPTDFKFGKAIFVTDENGDLVVKSSTDLNGSKTGVDFMPGDVVWMPLIADGQKEYAWTDNAGSLPAFAGATGLTAPVSQLKITSTDGTTATVADFNYQVGGFIFSNAVGTNPLLKIDTSKFAYLNAAGQPVTNVFVNDGGAGVAAAYKNVNLKVTSVAIPVGGVTAGNIPLTTNEITNLTVNVDGTTDLTLKAAGTAVNAAEADKAIAALEADLKKPQDAGNVAKINALISFLQSAKDNILTAEECAAVGIADAAASGATALTINNVLDTAATTQAYKLNPSITTVKFDLAKFSAVEASDGKITLVPGSNDSGVVGTAPGYIGGNTGYGSNGKVKADDTMYTGYIDKDWSINLLEDSKGAEELIDSAEFYRADAADMAMYSANLSKIYGNNALGMIEPNGVYIKVTLKDYFNSVSDATLKYYVYVADNDSGNVKTNKTDKVYVTGKYKNNKVNPVDFNWSNNANAPAVWQVKKGENGTAVFDFKDKAFFTVKMYSEEKMYLDMNTAYDKIVAGDFTEADFDAFYNFQGTNANFSRAGELVLESEDANLFVYQIDKDGNLTPVDAEYVKDYKIAHTNSKVNGYKFNTKELGNFVLSANELEATEEEVPEEEVPAVPETTPETTPVVPETVKPNPETGANDFVGVAVALAVVSVAAAGALALKK